MKKLDSVLCTTDNEEIDASLYGIEHLNASPCIILVHGFKGFKDWGFGPYIANHFAKNGFFVITFNFSFNGIAGNSEEFTELDKFARNTFSREISELTTVIESYKNGFWGATVNKKIALLGHSRGGAISLLTAFQQKDINVVVLWASVSKLDRYSERQKEQWRKKGYFEVLNQRTKQVMRLDVSLLDDLEKNKEGSLNIKKAVSELNRPLFIAHGEQDLAVPIREGEELYHWSDKEQTEFYRIPSTGHTFDIKHPFEGTNKRFDNLLSRTTEFLIRKLI